MSEKRTVFEAVADVTADMGAVGKDSTSGKGNWSYQYRGIEAVMNALHPLLAKHGVVIVPRVVESSHEWLEKSDRLTVARYEYDVYGPDGSSFTGALEAEGVGQRDKSAVIASSYAYRQFVCLLFCIPTQDSIDAESNNDPVGPRSTASGGGLVAPPAPPSEDPPMVDADKRTRFLGRLADFKAAATDEDMVAVRERLVEVGAMLDTGHVVDPLPVPVFLAAMDVVDDEWPEAAPAFGKDEGDQTVKAKPYTKADLLFSKPAGMGDDEFMDRVLERAREMTPNKAPKDVINSWDRLRHQRALVREIVDQIEAGTFLAELPEPF